MTSRPDPIDSATDVAAVASTAATRVQGRAHAATRARADARFALAVVLLAAVDWLTVAGCFAAVWEIREKLLRQLFPELSPLLLPLSEYFQTLYLLLPWSIAFAEAGLYSGRVLFWEEARRCLRACTLAAVFATLVVFATHASVRLSRLVLVGTWISTAIAHPSGFG